MNFSLRLSNSLVRFNDSFAESLTRCGLSILISLISLLVITVILTSYWFDCKTKIVAQLDTARRHVLPTGLPASVLSRCHPQQTIDFPAVGSAR
jgi:hypothetical protein